MRGLGSGGGSTATVGFYLDESPLSASAVALNGRTVIDPDLFDLNHVEVLRGPQGTLYGAGSMGGTIKLVTNPPRLGSFEGAASVDASNTTGGSLNGGGNLMLNIPIGDKAALRFVTTDKYISGWIDRKVVADPATGQFPLPTNFGINPNAPGYYATRGNVEDATVLQDIKGSNLERFASARAILLVEPVDGLSVTGTLMYQRIDADGYNTYQDPPGLGGYAIYQPYDQPEPYYDSFKLASLKILYHTGFADLTSSTSYWKRDVVQSQDSTEALQNIFNMTNSVYGPAFVQNLYQEEDPTTQISEELRLTSNGTGPFEWVAGLFATDLHSWYITTNQNPVFANTQACPLPAGPTPGAVGGTCPASAQYDIINGGPSADPKGIVFNDNNPNITKQTAVFGEASYKIASDWKVTAGLRFYKFQVSNISYQTGFGTASGNEYPTCVNGTGAVAGGGNGSPCVLPTAEGSGTGVLPKVNLSYTPTPDLTLYGTLAKGSRPGGVNLPIPISDTSYYYCGAADAAHPGGSGVEYLTSQPSYYGPDSIWSFELGEKARFNDRRFTVNADLFYVRWTDIQQLIVLGCGYPYNTNVGNAKSYGPELEISAKITDKLTTDLTGAYTQAYINDPITTRPGRVVAAGTRINNIPRYTGSLAFNYETVLPGALKGIARLAESYVGPTDDVAVNRETLPSYGLLDARAGVARNAWSAFLFGTNLTNHHAALTIDNTVFAWQQPTITRVSTNQPRTIGLQFNTKF